MPQDPNLYGQRPPKRQKKSSSTALPSSLAFTSELSSLISSSKAPSSSIIPATSQARPRPSKSKPDIFATVKAKRKADKSNRQRDDGKLILMDVNTTEDEKNALLAARRKMEDKARLYAAMKRGDYVPKEGEAAPLVDFDRKWAETQEDKNADASSDDDDDDSGNDDDDDNTDREIITFTDEFGRQRSGTRAEKERLERRIRASQYGAAELERMSARPKAPEKIIYGDAVQAEAFVAADEEKMEEMARRRDRSLTPPEMKHYDANGEIRTKGVGFFQFSKDEETRQKEMESLAKERETTERERLKKEEEREIRKREVAERRRIIDERRKAVGEKRAAKMADTFLSSLAADMESVKE
ncbi:hypothetical protein N0V82_004491 [Gnomoniopsis sp. IMI 355080]|nr:hypothetical protein N0V82_004491 [Gnomoniopsis sp. IMI 355080]